MNLARGFWDQHRDQIRALLSQMGWFIISLLLAMVVWIVATLESDPVTQREFASRIDIRLVHLDSDVLLVNQPPQSARVTVRAPQSTWSRLTKDDILVQADIGHARNGDHVIPLKAVMTMPGEVVHIEPSQIVVQLDIADRKTVPVVVGVSGEPALGYVAKQAQPDPAEVVVYGPASLVTLVAEAYAEFPLNGERLTVSDTLPLVARGQGQEVANVQMEPAAVRVTLPIETREGYRTVPVVPNIPRHPPAGYTWQLESYEPDTITVTGPQSRLDSMAVPVVTEAIDLSDKTESLELEVGVILPNDIEPAVEGQTITVRITIEAIEGFRQFDAIPIALEGLTPGYQATVSPETVALLITGPRLTVSGLTEADVRVVVDVTGLVPDTYQLNPTVSINREGIAQDKITVLPRVVEVQIIEAGAPTPATPTPTP